MIIFTAPFISVALALIDSVSGAYIFHIEARNPATGHLAADIEQDIAKVVKPRPLHREAHHVPQKAGSGADTVSKKATTKLFASKLIGGGLVGLGVFGTKVADNMTHPTEGSKGNELQRRKPGMLTRTHTGAAPSAGHPSNPNTPHPGLQKNVTHAAGKPSKLTKILKHAGGFLGLSLVGGAGEYYGGKLMDNATESITSDGGNKRDLERELLRRDPTGVKIDDIELYAGDSGLTRRNATTTTTAHVTSSRRGRVRGVAGVVGTVAALGSASALEGYTEGMIGGLTPEALKKFKDDPKGTFKKILPSSLFGEKSKRDNTATQRPMVDDDSELVQKPKKLNVLKVD